MRRYVDAHVDAFVTLEVSVEDDADAPTDDDVKTTLNMFSWDVASWSLVDWKVCDDGA